MAGGEAERGDGEAGADQAKERSSRRRRVEAGDVEFMGFLEW